MKNLRDRILYLTLFIFVILSNVGNAEDKRLNSVTGLASLNTPIVSESIGSYTNGCISGAMPLPLLGNGYQVMRVSRQRYFGHPTLIDFIEKLGSRVVSSKLGTLLIGDLGQFRGGPMLYGHRSHQNGLDVDIWFLLSSHANERILTSDEREIWSAASMVDAQANVVDSKQWTPAHAKILETAARQPEVDRIFVNPSIKQALCEQKSPETVEWLRKIRPWWKHDDHFHVRLKCPAKNTLCESQQELPAGDGCDASLSWWFTAEAKQGASTSPAITPPLPAQCEKLLLEK
ncbi:penicillin-insensitive murein endopeptidase [Methylomonas sp. AM2-LC]|uniref:penicillin-insensitive murein endopeptidase n=1 Tax=Methylomonas sp. AM2-LC TaxID=3153301 RepID=UPI003262E5D9